MALAPLSTGVVYNPYTTVFRIEDWVDEYAAGPVTGTSPWISTLLASGTATTSGDGNLGAIVLSGAGTADNSGAQVQYDTEWITSAASRNATFGAYFKMSNVTDQHFFAGFAVTDTTLLDGADAIAGLTAADCIGFFKPDDAATMYMVAKATTGGVVLNSAVPVTLVADTYYWMEFVVRWTSTTAGTVSAYVNGLWVGDYPLLSGPTTDMAPSVAQVSGTASGTISSTIRKVYAAIEY